MLAADGSLGPVGHVFRERVQIDCHAERIHRPGAERAVRIVVRELQDGIRAKRSAPAIGFPFRGEADEEADRPIDRRAMIVDRVPDKVPQDLKRTELHFGDVPEKRLPLDLLVGMGPARSRTAVRFAIKRFHRREGAEPSLRRQPKGCLRAHGTPSEAWLLRQKYNSC